MEARIVNRRDLDFVLYEMLEADRLAQRPRYAEHSRETFSAVLDAALRIASEQFAPHAHEADENEPRLEQGRVLVIPEVKRALQAFCEAGFMSASFDEDLGGMQLPVTVAQAALAIFRGASIGIDP
jgi:butyryl-CoA dehydrogenase